MAICEKNTFLLLRSFGDLNDVDTSLNFAIRKLSILLTRRASLITASVMKSFVDNDFLS